jgi:hypothetical protein
MHSEAREVMEILAKYGLEPHESKPLVDALRKRPNDWVEFMMRFLFFSLRKDFTLVNERYTLN